MLQPGQARLVVEMDAGDVGTGTVHEGPASDAACSSANDERIGPVAFLAQVHLVGAAHRAVRHEIDPGTDEVPLRVLSVMAVEEVEAETVLALGELGVLLRAAPVDETKAAAA